MSSILNHHQRDWAIGGTLLFCLLVLGLCGSSVFAKGDLNAKQARKLIAAMPGLKLKSSAVRVIVIRPVDNVTLETKAEIATAFRLENNPNGQWRVAELRTGEEEWQDLGVIKRALKAEPSASPCDTLEGPVAAPAATDPSNRRARCLLADLLGVQLPSDAVRVRSISPMSLPFSSRPSALVEALVAAEFQFKKSDKGSWRVSGVRTGTRSWVDPEVILSAVNAEKVAIARAELDVLAKALEDFRRHRGFYVESKSEAVLVDFLAPRYLPQVIRLDPWRRPYVYEGTRDSFSLLSLGPDGKESTSDDIVLTSATR